jgi:hypothetical protein
VELGPLYGGWWAEYVMGAVNILTWVRARAIMVVWAMKYGALDMTGDEVWHQN